MDHDNNVYLLLEIWWHYFIKISVLKRYGNDVMDEIGFCIWNRQEDCDEDEDGHLGGGGGGGEDDDCFRAYL